MVTFGSALPLSYDVLLQRPPAGLTFKTVPLHDPFETYRALRPFFQASFILESAPGSERLATHTFLGFGPRHVLRYAQGKLTLDGAPLEEEPLPAIRTLLQRYGLFDPRGRPRRAAVDAESTNAGKYLGGLVGHIGYDFVSRLEPVPRLQRPHPFPELELGLYLDGLVFDHRAGRAYYFSHAEDRSDELLARARSAPSPARLQVGKLRSADDAAGFQSAVRRAQEAIREGEAYQIVLSRQWSGRFAGDPLTAYASLRRLNPSPYMYFLEQGPRRIVGSSPEMLVSVQGRRVTTYPIAGTRPLGRDEAERRRLAAELLADEKERAEHVMLVDLARNDVGRIARTGSVHVSAFMSVERFSHVQHLVSCVQGELREDSDGLDALVALFPAGTVSGAPKVRAMQLIAELEPVARGPYAGVVGYLSLNGNLDTAIAIRTAFFCEDRVYLQAGAGIVADSLPEREFFEIEHKLGALRQALDASEERR